MRKGKKIRTDSRLLVWVLQLEGQGLSGWRTHSTMQGMQETWVQFLGLEDPLRRVWQSTSVFLLENFMNRGAWGLAVHSCKELDTIEATEHACTHYSWKRSMWEGGRNQEFFLTCAEVAVPLDIQVGVSSMKSEWVILELGWELKIRD